MLNEADKVLLSHVQMCQGIIILNANAFLRGIWSTFKMLIDPVTATKIHVSSLHVPFFFANALSGLTCHTNVVSKFTMDLLMLLLPVLICAKLTCCVWVCSVHGRYSGRIIMTSFTSSLTRGIRVQTNQFVLQASPQFCSTNSRASVSTVLRLLIVFCPLVLLLLLRASFQPPPCSLSLPAKSLTFSEAHASVGVADA